MIFNTLGNLFNLLVLVFVSLFNDTELLFHSSRFRGHFKAVLASFVQLMLRWMILSFNSTDSSGHFFSDSVIELKLELEEQLLGPLTIWISVLVTFEFAYHG